MRKLYLMMAALLVMSTQSAVAQCPAGRYLTEIFTNITLDSVTYSTPYGLKVDIYQPAGDTLTARPLIILGHGGSFVSGTREDDSTIDWLCTNFAKRGYVTASIDYRLASPFSLLDSTSAITEVVQAISDGKAAIRYFVKDRATTNTYKIDTNNIFIGGNSAGAVLYMHVGYLDSLGECPSDISAIMTANGGFEGNSGNAGYTTRSKAIIDLAGGLNHVAFVGPGDKPSVNAQGSNDDIVPYTCADALSGTVQVTLCGLGSLEPQYDAMGINHMSHVFPGDGHVPWSTNPVEFVTVDSLITVFLYNMVCTDNNAGVASVANNASVSLFPNPAGEVLNIKASESVGGIAIYDETGRCVLQASGINRDEYELNTSGLNAGMYFVRVQFSNENNPPLVKRIVVE